MLKNKHCIASAVFFLGFLLPVNVFATSANITKIVFTAIPQNTSPDAVSDIISIQTQNASGNSESIDETNDLFLTSSSQTGQFSSSATTWKSVGQITMSKNTENKNFYYKNTNSGQDTITAKIVGRTTGITFSASQPITIGGNSDNSNIATTSDSGGNNTATTTDTSATSTPDIATTTIITKTVYVSTHSSSEDLSNWQETLAFNVSAGRERMTYIGIPVKFSAKYNILANTMVIPEVFNWSFGDGTQSSEKTVFHTYKHPGDYTVVLNGTYNGINSVSRTVVHVLSPQIGILAILNGDVQVVNNGDTEINLGSWKLKGSSGEFTFPVDTIILPGKKIILSNEDTKIHADHDERLQLYDPSGGQVASADFIGDSFISASSSEASSDTVEKNLGMTVEKAELLVSLLKKQNIPLTIKNDQTASTTAAITDPASKNNEEQALQEQDAARIASVGESINLDPPNVPSEGFWSRFLGIFRF